MPQLDIVTFFSQFFWLCVFYMGFYYLLYKYFLPVYSRSILFRDKFTCLSSVQKNASLEEKGNIEESLTVFQNRLVYFSKNFFENSKNQTGLWYQNNIKKINQNDWKGANLLYIKAFAARIAQNNLGGKGISMDYGEDIFLFGLSKGALRYNSKRVSEKGQNNGQQLGQKDLPQKKEKAGGKSLEITSTSPKAKGKLSVKALLKPEGKKNRTGKQSSNSKK